jgi:large conductance mechanosensitive channel
MLSEFKNFIMRGNVLELAVAVIIAAAFGAVITSFTNDILFPPIGMLMGDVDLTEMKYVLQAAEMDASGAVLAEEVAIRWGKWLKYIIDFLIIAFVLFMIIRSYNKANPPAEAAPAGPSSEDLLAEIRDLLKKQ